MRFGDGAVVSAHSRAVDCAVCGVCVHVCVRGVPGMARGLRGSFNGRSLGRALRTFRARRPVCWPAFTARATPFALVRPPANITDSHLVTAALPFITPLYPRTFPSVQWPVDGVPGSTCEKEDPAYASTIDALSTTPPGLLTWDLTLTWSEPTTGAAVTDYFIDPVTFTGKSEPVLLLPVMVRLNDGAGLLTKPKVVRC